MGLLACPFCGGEAILQKVMGDQIMGPPAWYVECSLCGAQSKMTIEYTPEDKTEAIKKWQRRKKALE